MRLRREAPRARDIYMRSTSASVAARKVRRFEVRWDHSRCALPAPGGRTDEIEESLNGSKTRKYRFLQAKYVGARAKRRGLRGWSIRVPTCVTFECLSVCPDRALCEFAVVAALAMRELESAAVESCGFLNPAGFDAFRGPCARR
jgi:hypothetical protein